MVTTPFMFLHFSIFIRLSLSCFLVPLCVLRSHGRWQPFETQGEAIQAQPRPCRCTLPTGHTKVACPHTGAGGSHAARRRDGQGSCAAASSHQAHVYVGDDPIFYDEEETLECAGRTNAVPPICTPCHGPGFVSELVPFDGNLLVIREPVMAPNPCGGWTPPLPVDHHHQVWDIRSMRGRNLYAKEEKDLRLEYRLWHPFHFDYYESILYNKFLKKR